MSEQPPAGAPSADDDPEGPERFLVEAATRAAAQRPASVAADPWRQAFHVQPPVGLLNDPNGLVQHRGTYHLCYQWHPFAPLHGLKMWAHVTSPDLVHWTAPEPVVTEPPVFWSVSVEAPRSWNGFIQARKMGATAWLPCR